MLILLESTENICREFFEYYKGSLILDWYYYLAGSACQMLHLLFIEYDDITCSSMVPFFGS